MSTNMTLTAFADTRLIATGDPRTVLSAVKQTMMTDQRVAILIFEDQTGKQVDFDFRGSVDDVLARLPAHPLFAEASASSIGEARPGPGRPKLGVVSREVSLLPRHWEWLERQSSGASATIRRLVDDARKATRDDDAARLARDAAGKFMWVMAGNLENFEEATRALYAGDRGRLDALTRQWPVDIRDHVARLLGDDVSSPSGG